MQARGKAADDAQQKAEGDVESEGEVDHALQDKIVFDLPLIIN
jgi:hypothetical protein